MLDGEYSSLQHAQVRRDMFLFAKKAFTVRLMLNLVAAAEESSTGVSSGTGLTVLETGACLGPEL
jgi:hypothetical protein